jgi:glycine cleavage system H protein
MSKTYFTEEHEWISVDGDIGTVGITDYAQHALGDIVFAELPAIGAAATKGKEIAVVESVKAASDVYSPVTGEVTGSNSAVADQPGLINESPEENGWFFKIRLSNAADLDGLMDRAAYDAFLKGLE